MPSTPKILPSDLGPQDTGTALGGERPALRDGGTLGECNTEEDPLHLEGFLVSRLGRLYLCRLKQKVKQSNTYNSYKTDPDFRTLLILIIRCDK